MQDQDWIGAGGQTERKQREHHEMWQAADNLKLHEMGKVPSPKQCERDWQSQWGSRGDAARQMRQIGAVITPRHFFDYDGTWFFNLSPLLLCLLD